jgi:hypothetical protein
MIFAKYRLIRDPTLVVKVTSVSNCHLCMDFCAHLVEVESDCEVDTQPAQHLLVENMVFLQVIEVDHTVRDLVN